MAGHGYSLNAKPGWGARCKQMLRTPSSKICGKASSNPVRVIGFNVSEGWVRDVSEAITRKLRELAEEDRELPDSLHFVEEAAGT
jgi:hypothetical protein